MATDSERSTGDGTDALLVALRRLAVRASERARGSGEPALVSVTTPTTLTDPTAAVIASRADGEAWFCFEQPERARFAVAGLGEVRLLTAAGEDRFHTVARHWERIVDRALSEGSPDVPGSGPVAFGGFAFAPDGCGSLRWRGFAPAAFVVPELSLARRHDQVLLTVNAEVGPDDEAEDVVQRTARSLARLRETPLPLYDPAPVGRPYVASAMAPAHYEAAVARAVELIRGGTMEKIVLAREVEVQAATSYDAGPIIGLLREAFGSSFVYAVGRKDSVFLGATPELLVRREGQRASTIALAGSARRSSDPATDDHLGEQLLRSDKNREENAIVARRIVRTLRSDAVWVTAAEEPSLIRVANIQHLARPVRAQLASPISVVELAGRLHPTPAVGAEPAEAVAHIPALEGLDRGWYAGPLGWTDAGGNGEFCVALRGALLRGAHASCYAGCGVVADSEPASELAETEIKLGVMLPVLTG